MPCSTSDVNDIACDPCSLTCPASWSTKYLSAHKICTVERLSCELPVTARRVLCRVERAAFSVE